jgi:hypothetical protein
VSGAEFLPSYNSKNINDPLHIVVVVIVVSAAFSFGLSKSFSFHSITISLYSGQVHLCTPLPAILGSKSCKKGCL